MRKRGSIKGLPVGGVRFGKEDWAGIAEAFLARDPGAVSAAREQVWYLAIHLAVAPYLKSGVIDCGTVMDIAGDATVAAIEKLDRWNPRLGSSLSTWAYTSVVYGIFGSKRSYSRKTRNQCVPLERDADDTSLADILAGPDTATEEVESRDGREFLDTAIASLTPLNQKTVRTCFGYGADYKSPAEYADAEGVARQSVYLRLKTAIGQLREYMQVRHLEFDAI